MKNKEKIINMIVYLFAIIMMVLAFLFISFDSYNIFAFFATKIIGIIMFTLSFMLFSIEYR